MNEKDAAPLTAAARRRLAVTVAESASFSFAIGCLVHFWANYTAWAADRAEQGARAGALLLATLIVLIAAETAASFLGAALVERLSRRKRFVVLAGLASHGAWLVFGLGMFIVPPQWCLALTFALVAWRGAFDGLLISPWFDLAARVVPAEERARFFSVRLFAGAAALPLGSLCSGALFRTFDGSPQIYWALAFVLAGLVSSLGDFARIAYVEPAAPVDEEARRRRLPEHLLDNFRLVLRDARFRWLCLVTAAASLTETLFPQVLGLFGKLRLGLSDKDYQLVALPMQMSPLLACFLLPRFVAWLGWRGTYALLLGHFAAAFAMFAAAACILPGLPGLVGGLCGAALVLAGLARGWSFADANVLYGIASPERRPSYLVMSRAVANAVAVVVMLALAAPHGRELPYTQILAGLATAMIAAAAVLVFVLREPRAAGSD